MTYVTVSQAVAASRRRYSNKSLAESAMRKAAAVSRDTNFHIFLSHASEDAEVVNGVATMLEDDGLTVYIDWKVDAQLDRSAVTSENAELLRERMDHCRFLLYVSTRSSSNSKWMPWELGYFDGRRPGKVGIFPVVADGTNSFQGIEYLGLYPSFQRVNFTELAERIGTPTGVNKALSLKSAVLS